MTFGLMIVYGIRLFPTIKGLVMGFEMLFQAVPIFSQKRRFLFTLFPFSFFYNFPWITGSIINCNSTAYCQLVRILQIQNAYLVLSQPS